MVSLESYKNKIKTRTLCIGFVMAQTGLERGTPPRLECKLPESNLRDPFRFSPFPSQHSTTL